MWRAYDSDRLMSHLHPVRRHDGLRLMGKRYPTLGEKQWVLDAFTRLGTTTAVAAELGCARDTVSRAAKKHGLQRLLVEEGTVSGATGNGHMPTGPEVTDLSASRIRRADTCMLSYNYHYIDQLPAPAEKARTVFGSVVHNGVERWYGEPDSNNHKNTKLSVYVDEVWWEWLPQDVAISLRHTLNAERGLCDLEQLISISRPAIKNVRQTKDFMTSPQFKVFEDARDELLAASLKCETMTWPQNENAFQAYMKSMHIARLLEDRWKRMPRPVVVEYEFHIPFAGLNIKGVIDQIRVDPKPTGEAVVDLTDLKTGTQPLTQMEAFIQAFLYNEACLLEPNLPTPDIVTFWLARQNKPQHGRIDRERHTKLAERILRSVKQRVESGDKAPHYGKWCSYCDFRPLCEAEIGLWTPGEDSLVLT